MIPSNAIQTVGSPPAFPNLSVLLWSLFNMFLLFAIVALIVWYLKKQSDYRKQVVIKLDHLISLHQPQKPEDK